MLFQYGKTNDTICAPATAHGPSAISMIRVSGSEALSISERFFKSLKSNHESRKVILGNWKDASGWVDQVMLIPFHAPASYTGEHSVEISFHGSPYIEQRILQNLVDAGCRLAEPGEFSFRAFQNGKMLLHETEAVAELIAGTSAASHRVAAAQMRGQFSKRLQEMRERLIKSAGLIELELDFSEEDVEFASRDQLLAMLNELKLEIQKLEHSFRYGKALKEGIPVAIIGAPNAGKSTLLNALLEDDRAIVSDIPGTTRDTIEERIQIEGIPFRFIDTAGIRDTDDEVEKLGIERSIESIRKAAIVLVLQDKKDYYNDKSKWFQELRRADEINPDAEFIFIWTKSDLYETGPEHFSISAKTGEGMQRLKEKIIKASGSKRYNENDIVITQTRHAEALKHCGEALARCIISVQQKQHTELLAEDLRMARHYLGSITGEIYDDHLLDMIFREFCIGK